MNSKDENETKTGALLKKLLLLGPHTCPWWFGYTFDNPLRRFVHRPQSIMEGLVSPGDTVVDIGCGLGYFSIALADLVGPTGRVFAFDVQAQMVKRARRRAELRGMADRITFDVCAPNRLGFDGEADFALAFWMLHEVLDPERLLTEVRSFLRPSGHLLIAEPLIHVPEKRFTSAIELATRSGFGVVKGPEIRLSRSIVCTPA